MTKVITLALILSCGAHSNLAAAEQEGPSEEQPVKPERITAKTQHFCCDKVDLDDRSGKGCSAINKELINSCDEVLYCPAGWGKSGGTVKCHTQP